MVVVTKNIVTNRIFQGLYYFILGDKSWMNLNALYAFCMLICGISTAVVPFLSDYTGLAVMAGLFGFFISANYSLTSPILVNYVSLEQFSNAYGLLLLVQGTVSNIYSYQSRFICEASNILQLRFENGKLTYFSHITQVSE